MTDFMGKEIKIGDYVILTCKGYRHLCYGRIVRITAKAVRVISPDFWGDYLTPEVLKVEDLDLDKIPQEKRDALDVKFYEYGRVG